RSNRQRRQSDSGDGELVASAKIASVTGQLPLDYWRSSSCHVPPVRPELEPPRVDLRGKRLLIFVVAYNAESTIEKVLSRIPQSLHCDGVEVLIIDDSSGDNTFANGLRYQQHHAALPITVLRTPENQGYGGNQKLGYRYAIDHGF